jgi:hypothetical protein
VSCPRPDREPCSAPRLRRGLPRGRSGIGGGTSRRSCSLMLCPSSAQHPATSLAPQPQRLSSPSPTPQPLEQRRIRHRPGMAADTLELRLAALLHIRCARSTRRAPHYRPGVARERVNHRLVQCHRRHRCSCVLKQCACTLKARRWAHSTLAGAERACMHLVRPLADTPCSRSLPICGRIGVSLSILCSGLLSDGGTSQTTWALRVRLGDARRAASLGPCAAV